MAARRLRIYFSGIGGSGVSAIAGFMRARGHAVAGSDRAFEQNPRHPACGALKRQGVEIVPHDGSRLEDSFDFMVMSTAVEDKMPEVIRARALGLPIKTRPGYLAELVHEFRSIAVSGTSGKSTAAGMLAFIMRELGKGPNFIGGGRVKAFMAPDNSGNFLTGESDLLVVEACESDGTITDYRPERSVVLNLDLDHHGVEKTARMFMTLLENTSGEKVLNADDPNLKKIIPPEAITFSIKRPSMYRADNITLQGLSSGFSVNGAPFVLPMPGVHNIYNALSCIALLAEMGVPLSETARVMPALSSIERRFDLHLDDGERLVVDDYAHNPHKIRCLMQTMKNLREGVCYIFQPHGFEPTMLMKEGYIEAFSENLRKTDHLILLPIFYSGGTVSMDISSGDLAHGIRAMGGSARAVDSREEALEEVRQWETCVVLGARDETLAEFAGNIARALREEATAGQGKT